MSELQKDPDAYVLGLIRRRLFSATMKDMALISFHLAKRRPDRIYPELVEYSRSGNYEGAKEAVRLFQEVFGESVANANQDGE